MSNLIAYLSKVVADIAETKTSFSQFERKGVTTHAIPFFGDVESAVALTVGVNPSAGEFVNREWPNVINAATLENRLRNYFTNAPVPPHPWFETWERALANLDISYRQNAAHLDLSPRVTAAMGTHTDWDGFANMIERDAKWFFELLPLCRKAKILLFSGTVTKRWYINDFVAKVAYKHGYRLTGNAESTGEGRVGFQRLIGHGRDIPVFFCSISPSSYKRQLLIQRLNAHKATLAGWING